MHHAGDPNRRSPRHEARSRADCGDPGGVVIVSQEVVGPYETGAGSGAGGCSCSIDGEGNTTASMIVLGLGLALSRLRRRARRAG
jgi:MYXO-CTERM domain-containing protein